MLLRTPCRFLAANVSEHSMKDIANRIFFYKFLIGELPLTDFEKWIYDNPELELEVGKDHYTDLISYDFRSRDLIPYIKEFVLKHFDWSEFENWRTIKLLTDILENKVGIVLATRKMKQLYLEQENTDKKPLISRGLAIGYESELDNCPIESEYLLWNKIALKRQLEPVKWYRKDILKCVEQELQELINPEYKTIDLEHVVSLDHLHEVFMERLNFPSYYGKNWDAFWDSITGLVKMPDLLVIKNLDAFEKRFKRDSDILKKIIDDYNKEFKDKKILITTVGNNC